MEKFLLENGISVEKRLDQFFLVNSEILEREAELAELEKNDVVLEIGPGIGNLTKLLAQKCRVITIEKDRQFSGLLKDYNVLYGDALELAKTVTFNKIVSNIPYSISQPLLLELLKLDWNRAVLLVQKEFAEKLVDGKLAVLIRDCGSVRIEEFVAAGNFYPPAVDSAIVVIDKSRPADEGLWKFLGMIYTKKNRNVRNVVEKFPAETGKKKVHQLSDEETRQLYEMNKVI